MNEPVVGQGVIERLEASEFGFRVHAFGYVGEALGFKAVALGDDFVVEGDGRGAAAKLMDFKTAGGFVGDVETFAVSARSEEDMELDAGVDGLGEGGFDLDGGSAVLQLT